MLESKSVLNFLDLSKFLLEETLPDDIVACLHYGMMTEKKNHAIFPRLFSY